MCKSCEETPDNLGRRCRDKSASDAVNESLVRSKSMNNAANALANGDFSRASNMMNGAANAQNRINGSLPNVPTSTGVPEPIPRRVIRLSPSSAASAATQIAQLNEARRAQGLPEIYATMQRVCYADKTDPIIGWELNHMVISGASQEELEQIALHNVKDKFEWRVSTDAILRSAFASMKKDSDGEYLDSSHGEKSTAARVNKAVSEGRLGLFRLRLAGDDEDEMMALGAREWIRTQLAPMGGAQGRILGAAVNDRYVEASKIGSLVSAANSYKQKIKRDLAAEAREEQARINALREQQARYDAQNGHRGPGRPPAPTGKFAGNPGDWIYDTGTVRFVGATDYYNSYLCVATMRDGSTVKWYEKDAPFENGQEITICGMIQGNTIYNNRRQSDLNSVYTKV